MSLAVERIELEIEPSVCTRVIFESGDRIPTEPVVEIKEEEEWCSSSSSIGRNSDDDEEEENEARSRSGSEGEENEVQSTYKGSLEMMEALEEVLPIRRGISRFYNGKSKSFTSLADVSNSSSIKDVAKVENAYTRRRRNVIAFNHGWDKNRNFLHSGGGISKRLISSSRSTLALAVAMSSSESISNTSDDSNSSSHSRSPPPLPSLPPLHPRGSHNNVALLTSPHRNVSAWRSFSVADLQQCATAGTANSYNNEKS